MEMYEDFALVYDRFMDETPYEEWCQFVVGRLKQDQITDGILLDLGCGTGSMTELLAKQGYDMIGVDLSDSMLDIAMEKRAQSGHNILYLQQDMREFELYGTVRAVICLCDSLNYLLEEDDLLTTFKLVNNYLDPNGLFIFDFNTVYKYETVIGDSTIAENREDCSCRLTDVLNNRGVRCCCIVGRNIKDITCCNCIIYNRCNIIRVCKGILCAFIAVIL